MLLILVVKRAYEIDPHVIVRSRVNNLFRTHCTEFLS